MGNIESAVDYKKLAIMAFEASENAYSPYSGFCVGAALLCSDGSIYLGCNIENSSYSATICAERVAIQKAVSEGKRDFRAIAIVGGKNGVFSAPCYPCGACRQVMSEFSKNIDVEIVLLYGDKKSPNIEKYHLSQLLPKSFSL